jgi:hypothetical protein
MSNANEFTQHEWNHLHDVVLDATWKTTKSKLTQQELESLFQELPEHIQKEAYRWGLNDSVVRDSIYVWYKENKM